MAFSQDLALMAAAGRLAQAIHYARAEAFGIAVKDWPEVDIETRHAYVDEAVAVLETLRPSPRRSVDYMRIVAGTISPEQPWGGAA